MATRRRKPIITNGFKNLSTFSIYNEMVNDKQLHAAMFSVLSNLYFQKKLWSDESESALKEICHFGQQQGWLSDMIDLNSVDWNQITYKICSNFRDGRTDTLDWKKIEYVPKSSWVSIP